MLVLLYGVVICLSRLRECMLLPIYQMCLSSFSVYVNIIGKNMLFCARFM